jgi:hypothetical protein
MTSKAVFNAEDWAVITTAPTLAGLAVANADRGGRLRESLAIPKAYTAAREREPAGLMAEVLTTPPTMDRAQAAQSPDELLAAASDALRRAVGALERQATDEEVVQYKRFVFGLAESVARAHREGGVLGFGGQEISHAEQAVLDAIERIFDQRHADPE